MKYFDMPFREDMEAATLSGLKTCTTRSSKYGEVGDRFIKRNVTFELTRVEHNELLYVANYLYRAEGFISPSKFIEVWNELHPVQGYQPRVKKWTHHYRTVGTRVIVAGSRGFDDYALLKETLDMFIAGLSDMDEVIIVSGTARGADQLGERYAEEHGFAVERHPADWDGWRAKGREKYAGIARNVEMAKAADILVAFNQGTPGTNHMIQEMKRLNKQVHEVRVSGKF